MGWRIDIETDDVADLGGELRIVGKLEGTDAVRRQAMSLPDALNRGQANARHLGHQPPGPVRRLAGRIAERQGHDPLGRLQRHAGRTRRAVPGGRVLSRSKPSTPSSMNRACQRQTAVLLTRAVRMISTVPTPSAVASTIRALQTCFCRLLRSSTIDRSRLRSVGLRWTTTPVRIPQTRTTPRGIPTRTLLSRSIH